jgi:hypothetical protein
MNSVLVLFAGFFLAMIGCELALRGTKLQTGLARVLAVHAMIAAVTLVVLLRKGEVGPVAFLLFWGGAYLSWFGARSHVESSILMRLLYLLRKGPQGEDELLRGYQSHYGEQDRLEELFRGGLAERKGDRAAPTQKGLRILRIASFLK